MARRLFRFPWRTAAQVAADVDEELAFHLDLVAQELVAEGWPPESAREEARRRFGDLEGTRRICRELDSSKETRMRWTESLGDLGQDLRFGGRQLLKSPGFTLVAVLTLALGIGATTAIFSVVYGVLLRPLPYPRSDELVRPVFYDSDGGSSGAFSAPNFLDLRSQVKAFSGVAAVANGTFNLSGGGEPERLQGASVSANYFQVIGLKPLLGRTLASGEDRPDAPLVTVVSEALWRRRFGADPGLVGKTLTLNGRPHTVVGVLVGKGQLPSAADVWVPMAFSAEDLAGRGAVWFAAIARLAPGVSMEKAQSEVSLFGRRMAEQYPQDNAGYTEHMGVVSLKERAVGGARKPLYLLLAAVGLVLLVACVNVANLLLVRASGRQGEVVVRAALGAGRARIVRQLLTESAVLALAGGGAGVALAAWLTRVMVAKAPRDMPRVSEIGLDGTALLFALVLSLATGLLFGLAPALQASRTDLAQVLREGTRGSRGRGAKRARSALVVLETALAVVLLAVAGLFLRSFLRLQEVDPGFKPAGAVMFRVEPPRAKYPGDPQLRAFTADLLARLERLPGVTSAGATVYGMPLQGEVNVLTFSIAGRPPAPPGKEESLRVATVTPRYFETLEMPIRRGRAFTPRDREGSPRVAVINETAVRRHFPGQDPLGQRIQLGSKEEEAFEVVGVVGDFKQEALDTPTDPQMFLPYDQNPGTELSVVVRSVHPMAVAAGAREQVKELDPTLPLFGLQTLQETLDASTAVHRYFLFLLGGFAVVSLALAAIGMYGVIAYAVRQRTREIGIRIALGATGDRVTRMVVAQGLALAASGAVVGLLATLVATRGVQSLLFEVKASDPSIYGGVALTLVLVAGVASYLPARRAARTDPQLALRGDL